MSNGGTPNSSGPGCGPKQVIGTSARSDSVEHDLRTDEATRGRRSQPGNAGHPLVKVFLGALMEEMVRPFD